MGGSELEHQLMVVMEVNNQGGGQQRHMRRASCKVSNPLA